MVPAQVDQGRVAVLQEVAAAAEAPLQASAADPQAQAPPVLARAAVAASAEAAMEAAAPEAAETAGAASALAQPQA